MTDEIDTAPFTRMAEAIERNKAAGFGGAFVIVPPANGGTVVETLILDASQDPAQFWALLQTKCTTQLAELDAAQRAQYGRVR